MEEEVGRSSERHVSALLFAGADGHLVDDLQGFGSVAPAGGTAITDTSNQQVRSLHRQGELTILVLLSIYS